MSVKVSKAFTRFARKTTSGEFDKARKDERVARGCPLDIGVKGTAKVEFIFADEPGDEEGAKIPYLETPLHIITPEQHRGTKITDSLNLKKRVKETAKRSEAENFVALLEHLEFLGCPLEITQGYKDFQEVVDWATKADITVHFSVDDGGEYQGRRQKRINFTLVEDEEEKDSADKPEGNISFEEGTEYCMFNNVKYAIMEKLDDDQLKIKSTKSGKERVVETDEVEYLD